MSSVTSIYVIVAIIGVIIALILAYFATLQSQGNANSGKRTIKEQYASGTSASYSPVENTFIKEIEPIVRSRAQSEMIGKKISHVFNKELEKG